MCVGNQVVALSRTMDWNEMHNVYDAVSAIDLQQGSLGLGRLRLQLETDL